MTYSEKLRHPQWEKKRLEIMSRDHWTCRDCGAVNINLQVHHTHYEKGEPWETPNEFLITLCEKCHQDRGRLELDIKRSIGIVLAHMTRIQVEALDSSAGLCARSSAEEMVTVRLLSHDSARFVGECAVYKLALLNSYARKTFIRLTGINY